jgi:hypothetical protein
LRVSPQAITKRLDVLPAAVMGQLLAEVCARLQAQVPPTVPHPRWAPVQERFSLMALVDGSTLEALRKKTQVLREREGLVLGGKMMVMVEVTVQVVKTGITPQLATSDRSREVETEPLHPAGQLHMRR